MSRGINKDEAQDLLLKSILLKGMNLEKKYFIKEINEYLKVGGDMYE